MKLLPPPAPPAAREKSLRRSASKIYYGYDGTYDMRLLPRLFDVSFSAATDERVHRECRSCGKNVGDETTECPACGGEIAAYTL